MAKLTPDATRTEYGLVINEKIIPWGAVWPKDSGAYKKGAQYKADRLLSGGTGKVKGVTIHNTNDLKNVEEDAEKYTRATWPNANMNDARVHYYVDDINAWQNLRGDEVGWHAGDGRKATPIYQRRIKELRLFGMKEKIAKTNAARLLDKAKVSYELIPYEVDENDLSAIHVAASLGENIEQVFKTLVLHGDKTGHFVCVIPGEHEVDLKLAAKVSGNKKCDLIPMKELLPLTGYIRGGCSPIGMKKHFPTYIHETCTEYPFIYISAGIRGLQIKIAPNDLIKEAKAEVTSLFIE